MSFKLADLLLGAPIKQAAINQARVLEHDQKASNSSSERPDRDELFEAASSNAPMDEIDPVECLERLIEASQAHNEGPKSADAIFWSPESEQKPPAKEVKFQVFDLFAEAKSLGVWSLRDSLELMVEPSSVRALKLIEQ